MSTSACDPRKYSVTSAATLIFDIDHRLQLMVFLRDPRSQPDNRQLSSQNGRWVASAPSMSPALGGHPLSKRVLTYDRKPDLDRDPACGHGVLFGSLGSGNPGG